MSEATPTVSIALTGINEAYHLKRLARQLDWVDEVIYVDCESVDNSVEIAEKAGWKVTVRPNNTNINVNRGWAIEQCTSDWVLYWDPDEEFTPELVAEIKERITSDRYNAFRLSRKNFFFGRWLKYGSQYPDVQLRLLRNGKARFPTEHVHERIQVEGEIGKLSNDMVHYPYLDITEYLRKFGFYTTFEAEFMYRAGVRPSASNALKFCFWKPLSRFFRRYLLKGGYRDGWQGLFAAAFDGVNFFVRYMKLCEIVYNNGPKDG